MKKLVILLTICVMLISASTVLAETFTDAGPTSTDLTGVVKDYKTSKAVTLIAVASTASYSAVSSHLSGTKVYGSSSGDAIIYTLTAGKSAGTAYTTAPTKSDSSEFFSGWDKL